MNTIENIVTVTETVFHPARVSPTTAGISYARFHWTYHGSTDREGHFAMDAPDRARI